MNLTYLQERFSEIANLSRFDKRDAISVELQQLSEPVNLQSLLDDFVGHVSLPGYKGQECYAHDNGFDKLVLNHDDAVKMKLRLHIWHPLGPLKVRPRQNIHNHRWDFSSTTLTGQAAQQTFRHAKPGERGEPYHHYRYFARGTKQSYQLEEIGTASLIKTSSVTLRQGDFYCMDAEQLHRVDIPPDMTTATLVITHENIGWVTNDLLSERSYRETNLPSPHMTTEEIISKVRALQKHLLRQEAVGA